MDYENHRLHRISIQIYKSQYQKLKTFSRPGISISRIIRDSIDNFFSSIEEDKVGEDKVGGDKVFSKVNPSPIKEDLESFQDTAVNLEAELNQLTILKNKELITSEEYVIMRKNLLGL